MNRQAITDWLRGLQDDICSALEKADGQARFSEDLWQRAEGGGGRSRVIKDGAVIEKGGVMFSAVEGAAPAFLFREKAHSTVELSSVKNPQFFATGISIVIHPVNPMVPIIHMNTRYFELSDEGGNILKRWFGGGIDLTPHYINTDDARYFHGELKKLCDKHDPAYYPDFKKWADDYFFLPHREETRGIGGIFFDRLGEKNGDLQKHFNFWKDTGSLFAPVYTELIKRNKNKTFSEQNKQWQLLRRGRYVEFNLVYDKGTKFGLESNGRIESILVSLPKTAGWEYNFVPEKNSEEEKTLLLLKKGIDWVGG